MTTILDQALDKALPSVFVDGRRLADALVVKIQGERYDAWEDVIITRSIESLCGSFTISMVDKWREAEEAWPIKPGSEIALSIGSNQVMIGYIDRLDVTVEAEDRKIVIAGRDKTGDLVDSSVLLDKNEYTNVTITDLARILATSIFGVQVKIEADVGKPFTKWTIKQGESVFECLERAAKLRGLLLISNEKSELVITSRAGGSAGEAPSISAAGGGTALDVFGRPSKTNLVPTADFSALTPNIQTSETALVQGENILSARGSYDFTERFQRYEVKGQSESTDVFNRKNSSQVFAFARDEAVKRARTKLIIADGSVDKTTAQKRANWEAITRAVASTECLITVQGWLKDGKKELWKPNELVRVDAPFIGIKSTMLVTAVTFRKSIDGTFTTLKVTRPDAYDTTKDTLTEAKDPTQELGWQDVNSVPKAYKFIKGLIK